MKKVKNYPFGLQIVRIEKQLSTKGIAKDTIDLKHVLDRTLTFKENKSILRNYLGKNIYPNEIKGRTSSFELFQKAQEVNEARSNKSKFMDYKKRARNVYYPDDITKKQYLKWRKAPNRNDIEGVDTLGGYF